MSTYTIKVGIGCFGSVYLDTDQMDVSLRVTRVEASDIVPGVISVNHGTNSVFRMGSWVLECYETYFYLYRTETGLGTEIILQFSTPQTMILYLEEDDEEIPFENVLSLRLSDEVEVHYQEDVEEIRKKINELQEALKHMASEREELERELESLIAESEKMRTDLETMNAEKDAKIQELADAQEKADSIRFSMDEIQHQIDECLEKELQKHLNNPLVEIDEVKTREQLAELREHLFAMEDVNALLEQADIDEKMEEIRSAMQQVEKSLGDIARMREKANAAVRQSLKRTGAKN